MRKRSGNKAFVADDGARRLVTTTYAAQQLGVKSNTIGNYIRDGELRAIKTAGGHYRIALDDLHSYMADHGISIPPQRDATTLVFTNQKGGVGKTTLTVNLGVLLAQEGLRVLVVDMDPQGHATYSLGYTPDQCDYTIYDAIRNARTADLNRLILNTTFGVDLAPINIIASVAERELSGRPGWDGLLRVVLSSVRDRYDYILIDTAPTLTTLTTIAFCTADYIVIPTQLEILSVRGLDILLEHIEEAREVNPNVRIAGAVSMMVQSVNADDQVHEALVAGLPERGIHLFSTVVRRSAEFKDVANEMGVLVSARPRSRHTASMRSLLSEVLEVVGGPGLGLLERRADGNNEVAVDEPAVAFAG